MADSVPTPDITWYRSISDGKRLGAVRCPFASTEKCPRYYQSLSLLGDAGFTEIDKTEDLRLLEKWKAHHLWPKTLEQSTGIMGGREKPSIYSAFCPEVAFDAFGLFATTLARYADELDLEMAHQRLARMGAPREDWRWTWSQISPLHYSECPLYSPLRHDEEHKKVGHPHMPPSKLERNSWIAGIIATVIAAILLVKEFWPHPHEAPPRPTIQQKAGDKSTQIGEVSGGYVSIVNQAAPVPALITQNSVSDLKADFALNASSQSFIYGTVLVNFIPPKDGSKNYLTVCFTNEKRACFNNFSSELLPGAKLYKYEIYEPAGSEWASKPEFQIQACIDDAKRINDYFAMSLEDQAVRDEPICQVKKLVRSTVTPAKSN